MVNHVFIYIAMLLIVTTFVMSVIEAFYLYIKDTIMSRKQKKALVLSTGIISSLAVVLLLFGIFLVNKQTLKGFDKFLLILWAVALSVLASGSILNFYAYADLTGTETDEKNKRVRTSGAVASIGVVLAILVIISVYAVIGYKHAGGVFVNHL